MGCNKVSVRIRLSKTCAYPNNFATNTKYQHAIRANGLSMPFLCGNADSYTPASGVCKIVFYARVCVLRYARFWESSRLYDNNFVIKHHEEKAMPTDENRRVTPETLLLSARFHALDELLTTTNAYMPTNSERLQIPADVVTEISDKTNAWVAEYAKYLDPNTRTRGVIRDVTELYESTLSFMNKFQQDLKNDTSITLTGPDRQAMQVHTDKTTRTPVPVQADAPNITQVSIAHMKNIFQTSYPDTAGESHHRMPAYNSLLVKAAFLPDGQPPTEGDYTHITSSGRSKFTLRAPEGTAVGSKGYVVCAYMNSRGELGPFSVPLEFLVN